MKEKLINFFKKVFRKATCEHVYGDRKYDGWFYNSAVDAGMDVRTHVYIQTCEKCGHTHFIMTYQEPVEPENKKR